MGHLRLTYYLMLSVGWKSNVVVVLGPSFSYLIAKTNQKTSFTLSLSEALSTKASFVEGQIFCTIFQLRTSYKCLEITMYIFDHINGVVLK